MCPLAKSGIASCYFIWIASVLSSSIWFARAFTRVKHSGRSVKPSQHCLTMTTTKVDTMTFVDSISDVADDYDVWLLDMWGVMHDGSKPYEGVLETIQKLKEKGKDMVILSNSSKRTDSSVKSLKKLGFDPSDFSQIITSGEVSYRMLTGDDTLECDAWPLLNKIRQEGNSKVFVLGSGYQDEEYYNACGWNLAPLEEADLILARGTFTVCDGNTVVKKENDEEEYFRVLNESLAKAADKKIPMLVSNPDKVRPDEGLPPMPGAIGDAYEKVLGSNAESLVKRIGKPFPEVYQIALENKDRTKAIMVGDALETDVTGGSGVGITTLWSVNDGIHGPDVKAKPSFQEGATAVLDTFNAKEGTYAKQRVLRPTLVVPSFQW